MEGRGREGNFKKDTVEGHLERSYKTEVPCRIKAEKMIGFAECSQ